MAGRLDGKVAIVTGAAQGQGAAEARLFAAEGARVVLGDVQDEVGEKLAGELGGAATYVHLDVSQEADWAAAVDSFKRVLASLEHADSVKRTEIGPKLMWHMGRSYQRLDRLFEASATFQVALERYSGDPQFDKDNAKGLFDTMRVLRMNEIPEIDVHIVASDRDPGGMGEPATALVAPAVANAFYKARFERVRSLPFSALGLA